MKLSRRAFIPTILGTVAVAVAPQVDPPTASASPESAAPVPIEETKEYITGWERGFRVSNNWWDGYEAGLEYGKASIEAMKEPEAVVMGALFDFAAHLTTLDQSITVGRTHEVAPILEALTTFVAARGIDGKGADVLGWQDRLVERDSGRPYASWKRRDPASIGGYRGGWAYLGTVDGQDVTEASLVMAMLDFRARTGRENATMTDRLMVWAPNGQIIQVAHEPRWPSYEAEE